MTSLEETFRTILAARLPADPKWAAWIDGAVAELAANVPPQGIDRDALIGLLGVHRWKDMGVDWCSCECGVTLRGDASLTEFPADSAFREHVADRILTLVRPVREVS